MNSWRNLSGHYDRQRVERALRIRGFDDGLSGTPARSKHALYQASWKRGMEKRRDLLLNDLDEAS